MVPSLYCVVQVVEMSIMKKLGSSLDIIEEPRICDEFILFMLFYMSYEGQIVIIMFPRCEDEKYGLLYACSWHCKYSIFGFV